MLIKSASVMYLLHMKVFQIKVWLPMMLSLLHMLNYPLIIVNVTIIIWGRTGLVVRASDSGSGDPGSILGRVGVLFPLARDIYSPKSTGNTQK